MKIKRILKEHSLKNIKPYITHSREPFFNIAKDYIDNKENIILDIGSGGGGFAKHINRNDIYMLDGNPETVEYLKNEYKNVYYGTLPKLPFEDIKFDMIHISHVVEHLSPQELYNLLQEIDRCLKPSGGILIISTPLLWDGFYGDMSHIKPYYPSVFVNYLCGGSSNQRTRKVISNNYKILRQQYRFRYKHPSGYYIYNNVVNLIHYIFQLIIYTMGFRKIEKTGYTLVLEKNNNILQL
jgi:SAM-dependent methyltransferase